jgi:hypothetical protein
MAKRCPSANRPPHCQSRYIGFGAVFSYRRCPIPPEWVKTKFPSYVEPHGKHEATSVRQLAHKGHTVRIITTYRVEVDGKPADLHLSVDEDGQVFTHATPFVTYASAVDLMKAVMDAYPEDAFSNSSTAPSDSDHDHHGDHS